MGQQTLPADPLASERVALLGEAAAAKLELDRLIAAFRDTNSAIPTDIIAQQGGLAALLREIASASPAELPSLKLAVASAVANVASVAQQADGNGSSHSAAELADAMQASQSAVQSAIDYTRGLDLQFASAEDERAYREREAERSAYIEAQQAKGTPEGSLNAAGAALGQMADAKAHGAGGPEFDQRWNELVATTERLREAARANGTSTEEFDRRLREDMRRILKSKGLSDAQIDAQFAAHPDPLEAAKDYVADGTDIDTLRRSAERADAIAMPSGTVDLAEVRDAIATLQGAGVVPEPGNSDSAPSHGIANVKQCAVARSV